MTGPWWAIKHHFASHLGFDIFIKKRKCYTLKKVISRQQTFHTLAGCSRVGWTSPRSSQRSSSSDSRLRISAPGNLHLTKNRCRHHLFGKCNHVYSKFYSKLWYLRAVSVWASPQEEGCLCSQRAVGTQEKHACWLLLTSWELIKVMLCLSFPRWPVALGASSGACSAGLPLRFQQHLFHVTLLGGRGDLFLASVMTCASRGTATEMQFNPGSWKSIQWWRSNITDIHILGLDL